MELKNLTLDQVLDSLSKNNKIGFVQDEKKSHSFSIQENFHGPISSSYARIWFYVYPIEPTFYPGVLNRLMYCLFPELQYIPAWRCEKFEYNNNGGLEMPYIRVEEPLFKVSILSEAVLVSPKLKKDFDWGKVFFYEQTIIREIIIKLFPSREFVDEWIKNGIVYLTDKESLDKWKSKYSE